MDTPKPTPKHITKTERVSRPLMEIHSISPRNARIINDATSTKIRFTDDFGKVVTISAPLFNVYGSMSFVYVVQKTRILAIPKESVIWIKSVCYMFIK